MDHTTFRELADAFFNKIKDYDFINMDESSAYEIAISYISPASVKFQNCTQDLDDFDDELQQFGFRFTNINFEILVNYMVIEWLTSNYITTQTALKARMSTADFHKYDNNNLLAKAIEVRSALKTENDQLAINKSYKTSKIFDVAINRKKV